jgi:hypothetical protein
VSKYYNRTASTLPGSRAVFSPDTRQNVMAAIDERFGQLSLSDLTAKVQAIHKTPELDRFRLFMFGASKALSNHGIAPRWQGLWDACDTDEQIKALRADAHLIDSYWLSITFPKHKTPNKRWRAIFEYGFDLELALGIGERQLHTARKTAHELDLSPFQQLGCIHFCQQATKHKIASTHNRAETAFRREISRAATLPQITEETARYRSQIWQCWLLADESPTRAAMIYKWMTGRHTDRATVKRTIGRMSYPVSRRQVE